MELFPGQMLHDARGGLFFIGKAGFHECGSYGGADGILTVTLFRAFCRTVERNGEEDGELQRRLRAPDVPAAAGITC